MIFRIDVPIPLTVSPQNDRPPVFKNFTAISKEPLLFQAGLKRRTKAQKTTDKAKKWRYLIRVRGRFLRTLNDREK